MRRARERRDENEMLTIQFSLEVGEDDDVVSSSGL